MDADGGMVGVETSQAGDEDDLGDGEWWDGGVSRRAREG